MTRPTLAAVQEADRQGVSDPTARAERFLATALTNDAPDAFVSVDPDAVRRDAAAAAERVAESAPLGSLEGALVSVKDNFAVQGHVSRAGTDFLAEPPTGGDALLVQRLRAAGASIAGKNRMTELGLSPIGVNPAGGSPRNPHAPDRPAGGSSSGGAAAVAAGLVTAAIGTDGGGSVRIPPALCGVYGLKPTFGRVPMDGAVAIGWWSLDHAGPIAGSLADLAAVYAVVAGVEPPRAATAGAEPAASSGDGHRRRLKIGLDPSWWAAGAPDAAVDARCGEVAETLAPMSVRLAGLEHARIAEYVTVGAEVAAGVHEILREGAERFTAPTQVLLQAAESLSAVDYLRAQQVRTLLAEEFAAAFRKVDVLVTPTTACTAPRLPARAWREPLLDEPLLARLTAYSFPPNLAGLPAITVPVGRDADGLPIGLQLIADLGREDVLFEIAAQLEREGLTDLGQPALWLDPLTRAVPPANAPDHGRPLSQRR